MYDPTQISDLVGVLPTLFFFTNHNDAVTYDFLVNNLTALYDLGYRNICTDGLPLTNNMQRTIVEKEIQVYEQELAIPGDHSNTEDLKGRLETNKKIAQFHRMIGEMKMEFLGCLLRSDEVAQAQQDPSFLQNMPEDVRLEKLAKNMMLIEQNAKGGCIMIVGYALGGVQLKFEMIQNLITTLSGKFQEQNTIVPHHHYLLVRNKVVYRDKLGLQLLNPETRASAIQMHFPRGLTVIDMTSCPSEQLLSEMKTLVTQHLLCTPPTKAVTSPKLLTNLAMKFYQSYRQEHDLSHLKVAILYFQMTVNACSEKGEQFNYLKSAALMNLGHISVHAKDYAHAKKYFQRCYDLRCKQYGDKNEKTISAKNEIAECDAAIARADNAGVDEKFNFVVSSYK